MNRSRKIMLAAVAGTAVSVGVVSAQTGPDQSAGTVAKAPAPAPLIPIGPPRQQDPQPPVGRQLPLGKGSRPAIAGTVRVAATAPDVAGGPAWAVRTWQRRGERGGRVWCAQLGRLVGDQFVWVAPGIREAGRVPARETETTVCAVRSPISNKLGVMVGSLPDRDGRDPAARIATTVIWGAVDRPVSSAIVEHDGADRPVKVAQHGFLKVLPGTATATRARLVVRDAGGGTRAAIPPAFYSLQGQRGITHISSPLEAEPSELRPLLRLTVGTDGRTKGLFLRPARAGRPTCFVGPTLMVAGRAAAQLDRRSGLVRQPPQTCTPIPSSAQREAVVVSGGWTSGDPTAAGTTQAAVAERRRVERRTQYGSGGILVVAPPTARLLEVRSPVGVKTARVTPERLAWIGWDGQPEVQRAMYPPFPGTAQWEQEIKTGHTPVSIRALDARGRQVGPVVYSGKVVYTRESVRRDRKQLALMERQMAEYKRKRSARAKARRERAAAELRVRRAGG